MKRQTAATTALILLTTLGLAACGDDSGQDASNQSGTDDSTASTDHDGADHNDADLTFVRSMIPHHEQAVQMAGMARAGAGSAAVRDLAQRIEAAQGPEIETMEGWLEEWGEEAASGAGHHGMDGMDHGDGMDGMDGMDGSGMPGMMSDGDLADLEASRGARFDRMFLTMMIAHHQGAIEMAETEQKDGKNDEAKALARQVERAQTREIAAMERLLAG